MWSFVVIVVGVVVVVVVAVGRTTSLMTYPNRCHVEEYCDRYVVVEPNIADVVA